MNTAALCLREIDFLFSPFVHRKLALPSRLVMAPLQRLFSEDGVPTEEMLRYYYRRAGESVGMIVSEPVAVGDAASADDSGMACFYGGVALRAWKGICRAVHSRGCRMAPLLTHVGMLRLEGGDAPHPEARSIGPSGISPMGHELRGEAMGHARIAGVIQAFARAAADARALGFDAVEINGADSHLIEQFLRKQTNHRLDEFGGDVGGRVHFACRVVQAVRKSVGRRMPIMFRFAQTSPGYGESPLVESPAELAAFLEPLCASGVDVFACAGRQAHLPAFPGSPLNLAGWTRMLTGRPTITEGAVGLPGVQILPLVRRLRAKEFDLISVGRAILADAEWGSKLRQAREDEIKPYTRRSWLHLF